MKSWNLHAISLLLIRCFGTRWEVSFEIGRHAIIFRHSTVFDGKCLESFIVNCFRVICNWKPTADVYFCVLNSSFLFWSKMATLQTANSAEFILKSFSDYENFTKLLDQSFIQKIHWTKNLPIKLNVSSANLHYVTNNEFISNFATVNAQKLVQIVSFESAQICTFFRVKFIQLICNSNPAKPTEFFCRLCGTRTTKTVWGVQFVRFSI